MANFRAKAIRIYYDGKWECHLKRGVRHSTYRGGSFKDSNTISTPSMKFQELINIILDVLNLDEITIPKVHWLVKGVKLQLDTDNSVLVWWMNTIPSNEGVVTVYFEREEGNPECDGSDNLVQVEMNPVKKRRPKLPIRRNYHVEDLSEEELDPLPHYLDEEISLQIDENSHVHNEQEQIVQVHQQGGNVGNHFRSRRRIDIDNIDPDEGYHSDDSDTTTDLNENHCVDFIENEEPEQYLLDDNLLELVNRDNICEPYEGQVNTDVTHVQWKLEVGMKWNSKDDARHYLRTYAIRNRFSIKKIHNDNIRLRMKCSEEDCDWYVRARVLTDGHTFKLKKAHLMHKCSPDLSGRTKMANAKWIAREIEEDVKIHKKSFTPKQIVDKMKIQHSVRVLYWQAWHARAIALESVHGSYEESYNKLPILCKYLLEANPGSIMSSSRDDNSKKWTGTCISFKACLNGFVKGCRPLIGIDGCFLKGKYGGVCLAMTSLYGNNGMFPIAIFLCQAENKENWMRFFEIMKNELNKHPQKLIIMSDRQKGLDAAVETEFPNAIQRYCFRHIFGNMREYHRGGHIEELTWNAARSYTEENFKKWIDKIDASPTKKKKAPKEGETTLEGQESTQTSKKKAAEKTPVEYLMSEDPKYWARYTMSSDPKVEHITNNFSESFNSWILELRDKPVHRLVIDYTLMMMNLLFKKKKDAEKMGNDNDVVPRVKKVIEGHFEWMRHYNVAGSSTHSFCVQNNDGKYWNVDLEKHTCDCKKWDISGIPCVHAVACIAQYSSTREIQWSRYCSPLFTIKYYKAAYGEWIKPPLHETSWADISSDVLPPLLHRRAGRPRVNRRRGVGEGPAPTSENQRKCGTCNQFGHYRNTCQMGPTKARVGSQVGTSGNGKRTRKNNESTTGKGKKARASSTQSQQIQQTTTTQPQQIISSAPASVTTK